MQHSSKATFESYSAACGMLQLQCLSVQRDLQHLSLLRFLHAVCNVCACRSCRLRNALATAVTVFESDLVTHLYTFTNASVQSSSHHSYCCCCSCLATYTDNGCWKGRKTAFILPLHTTLHYPHHIYIIYASKAMTYKVQ
jgi:hypothetical protein